MHAWFLRLAASNIDARVLGTGRLAGRLLGRTLIGRAASGSRAVAIGLNNAGRAALKPKRSLKLTLRISVTPPIGATTLLAGKVTLDCARKQPHDTRPDRKSGWQASLRSRRLTGTKGQAVGLTDGTTRTECRSRPPASELTAAFSPDVEPGAERGGDAPTVRNCPGWRCMFQRMWPGRPAWDADAGKVTREIRRDGCLTTTTIRQREQPLVSMTGSSSDDFASGAAQQMSVNGSEDGRSGLDAVPMLREDEKPPITRVLRVGAKGAERVAHATGVDRVVDQAVEEAIVRALRSPAVIRAIERDMTNDRNRDEIAQVVKHVLASDMADQAWNEVLESQQAQKLVERIAGAPEIRAAIASQGAGLMTDIGVRLTIITEEFDDALERIVRPRDPDSETDQAGLATRSVAAAIDLGLLFAGYALIASVVSSLFTAVVGTHPTLVWLIVGWTLLAILGGSIVAAFWTLAGQTPGMRFLSIRLIARGSHAITFGRALRRVFCALLSLLPLGLGYLAILRDPSRHAWHDRLTETEVVYDAVGRSAPHAGVNPTSAAGARHRHHPR